MTWQETLAKVLGLGGEVDQDYLLDIRNVLAILAGNQANIPFITKELSLNHRYVSLIIAVLDRAGLVTEGERIGRLWKSAMSETLKRDVTRAVRGR